MKLASALVAYLVMLVGSIFVATEVQPSLVVAAPIQVAVQSPRPSVLPLKVLPVEHSSGLMRGEHLSKFASGSSSVQTLWAQSIPANMLSVVGSGLRIRTYFDEFSIGRASDSVGFNLTYGGDSVARCHIDAWQSGTLGRTARGTIDMDLISTGPKSQIGGIVLTGGGSAGQGILIQHSQDTDSNMTVSCSNDGFGSVDATAPETLAFEVQFDGANALDKIRPLIVIIQSY